MIDHRRPLIMPPLLAFPPPNPYNIHKNKSCGVGNEETVRGAVEGKSC